MKYFSAIALCGLFVLGGCEQGLENLVNPSPTPAQVRAKMDFDAAMARQLRAQEEQKCVSFGAKPGTDVYVQCMVSLSQGDALAAAQSERDRKEDERRRREAIMRALASPKSATCTTSVIGSTAYTNCH